ncbi:MAG: hypothetical protein AAFX54_02400 [Pseudomonadota bacterium]
MTGNLLIDTVISIAAIAVMVAIARLLFPPPAAKVTEAAAMERLALDEPDFAAQAWLIDREGRAALAQGAAGDFALIKKLGLDLVTRRFRAGAVSVAADESALILGLGDTTLPRVVISTDDAAHWALKLKFEGDT